MTNMTETEFETLIDTKSKNYGTVTYQLKDPHSEDDYDELEGGFIILCIDDNKIGIIIDDNSTFPMQALFVHWDLTYG